MAALPQYLDRPRDTGETFGVLRWIEKGTPVDGGIAARESHWRLEGDPQVIILAKRLFPGSSGRGAGVAAFPANRRTFADLVWLQQRWPFTIEEPDRWEKAYGETVEHVTKRAELNRQMVAAVPGAEFHGE